MGALAKLFRAEPTASVTADELERAFRIGARSTKSGIVVTPESALKVGAVFACVRVLSEDVAKLPLHLYRRTARGGKERASDHPLYELLHSQPNAHQTAFEFREMLQAHLGLRGNAYAFIVRIGREIRELLPIHPDRVQVSVGEDWTITYDIQVGTHRSDRRHFGAHEILHLRGLATDGVCGLSPVDMAREAIGLAKAAEQHGARAMRNGGQPGLVVTHPSELSEQGSQNLRESIEAATSGENLFRVLLLEEDMKATAVNLDHRNLQFLESRKFQVAEVARWYRMPLHKIGDLERSTNNNIEHQGIEYLTDTLQPWLVRWEQRLALALLRPEERKEYFCEFNADGVVRGDIKSRYEAHGAAIRDGWKTRNEVRVQENMNPEDGLDEFLVPLNMAAAGGEEEES